MANVDVDTEGELIDTQWDVNYLVYITPQDNVSELVDTQWDVNITIDDFAIDGLAELIDTQWDVNMQKARFYDRMVFEINRYIVECKFAWSNPRVIPKIN